MQSYPQDWITDTDRQPESMSVVRMFHSSTVLTSVAQRHSSSINTHRLNKICNEDDSDKILTATLLFLLPLKNLLWSNQVRLWPKRRVFSQNLTRGQPRDLNLFTSDRKRPLHPIPRHSYSRKCESIHDPGIAFWSWLQDTRFPQGSRLQVQYWCTHCYAGLQ